MAQRRGAYRDKRSETTGDARRAAERAAVILPRDLAAIDRACAKFLGEAPARPRPARPKPALVRWVRWRSDYQGPSLALAMLARAAAAAIERAIAEGKATKPEPEEWRDPWEGVGDG